MRLNNYRNRNDLLLDWIIESAPTDPAILDVGANDGTFCPQVDRIAKIAVRFAGVDPDKERLERNQFISERYASTLEDAEIASESFDILYSFFVFEHVSDEERFIESASRLLKPGGSFYFITPNGRHYFAALASLFQKIGIQRRVLGIVRSKDLIDSYHYPALYRLNDPRRIERVSRKYGFDRFEYRYSELYTELSSYFPGPTKLLPWLWEKGIEATGREDLLVNLMGRMVKSPAR